MSTKAGELHKTFDHAYVGLTERLSREQHVDGAGNVAQSSTYDYDSGLRRLGQTTATAGGTTSYRSYALDANGSVEGLEGDTGALAPNDTYNYDPYGELDTQTGMSDAASAAPFRFQGFYSDSAVKTYDMQARSYRPDIGRFLSQDRFEAASADVALQSDPLTQNRYAFAGGNPINNVEWDGHYAESGDTRTNADGRTYDKHTGERLDNKRDYKRRVAAGVAAGARDARNRETHNAVLEAFRQGAREHPNDVPPCIPGACSADEANAFANRYTRNHDIDIRHDPGSQIVDFLTLGPNYKQILSKEPKWSKDLASVLEVATAVEIACSPECAPGAAVTGSALALRRLMGVGSESAKVAKGAPIISDPDLLIGDIAQSIADRGPAYLDGLLTRAQSRAIRKRPYLRRVYYGSVIQQETAAVLTQAFPGRFVSRGRGPDFLDRQTGREIELTTPGQAAAHRRRGGRYQACEMACYTVP